VKLKVRRPTVPSNILLPAQGECPLHRRSVVRLRACGCRLQPARSCYIVAAGRCGCSWRNLGVFSDQVFLVCNYKTINKHQWPTAPNYRYGSSSTVWLHGYLSITLIINTAISQVNLLKKGAQRHKDTCTCYCYFCVRRATFFPCRYMHDLGKPPACMIRKWDIAQFNDFRICMHACKIIEHRYFLCLRWI